MELDGGIKKHVSVPKIMSTGVRGFLTPWDSRPIILDSERYHVEPSLHFSMFSMFSLDPVIGLKT